MYDQALEDLNKVVTKATAGVTTISKSEIYGRMRDAARRLGKDGDSIEKTMCRLYYNPGAPYSALYRAYSARPGTAMIAKAAMKQPGYEGYGGKIGTMGSGDADDGDGSTADDDDDGGPSFSSLVDQHQAAHPKMSRSSSIDHVLSSREGRKSITVEKRNRLARAMGG
jgi:hypothetical protein